MFDFSSRQLNTNNRYINVFESCWLCTETSGREDHHIIPQCFGGVDGPQVNLCGNCHSTVHKCADKVRAGDNLTLEDMNPSWEKLGSYPGARYLIGAILNSATRLKGDPNKTVKFSTTLTAELSSMLKDIKNVVPTISNQEQALEHAIRTTHKRYFK